MHNMRTNLVMHFCCSACGATLSIKHEAQEDIASKVCTTLNESPKLPTGAMLRSVSPIQIEPCSKCIEKHIGPAKRLAGALRELDCIDVSDD